VVDVEALLDRYRRSPIEFLGSGLYHPVYQTVRKTYGDRHQGRPDAEEISQQITQAYDHILTAETSCNFYWGSHWVHRSFDSIEKAYSLLDAAMSALG
jgi:hypothetical protein